MPPNQDDPYQKSQRPHGPVTADQVPGSKGYYANRGILIGDDQFRKNQFKVVALIFAVLFLVFVGMVSILRAGEGQQDEIGRVAARQNELARVSIYARESGRLDKEEYDLATLLTTIGRSHSRDLLSLAEQQYGKLPNETSLRDAANPAYDESILLAAQSNRGNEEFLDIVLEIMQDFDQLMLQRINSKDVSQEELQLAEDLRLSTKRLEAEALRLQ